jgi:ankyrin repeat protein
LIEKNDIEAVRALHTTHPLAVQHINTRLEGFLPLSHAVWFDLPDMLFEVHQLGATNVDDKRGTPLRLAVEAKKLNREMLRMLLRLSLVHEKSTYGVVERASLLSELISRRTADPVDDVRFLADECGFRLWLELDLDRWRPHPLMAALTSGHAATVDLILATHVRGVSSNLTVEVCAVSFAIKQRNHALLSRLLRMGFNLNNTVGETLNREPPIALALRLGEDRMVGTLLFHGADVKSWSQLVLDAMTPQISVDTLRRILAHGAQVNVSDVLGPMIVTPLRLAAEAGRTDVMALLVRFGANLDLIGTPSRPAARLLLACGTDPALLKDVAASFDEDEWIRMRDDFNRQLFKVTRLDFLRIAVALEDLGLPALVTHDVCVAAYGEVPMHLLWRLVTKVKHFKK